MTNINFSTARKIMRIALKENGLYQSYKSNIAMCIYNNRCKGSRLNMDDCNEIAEKLIKLIWD